VTFAGDSGHQAKADDSNDAPFAVDDEALLYFGSMHIKKTRDAVFEIAKSRYGKSPKRLYFSGGSTGGREGLTAALRWPDDYDGISSNYPTANFMGLRLWGAVLAQVEYPDQSKPPSDPAYAAGWIRRHWPKRSPTTPLQMRRVGWSCGRSREQHTSLPRYVGSSYCSFQCSPATHELPHRRVSCQDE
jgi:hypothetical protein